MQKYGYATDNTKDAVCASRCWEEHNCSAGYLLFCFGTKPDGICVEQNALSESLHKTQVTLQTAINKIVEENGQKDQSYVTATLIDTLKEINRDIYQMSCFIGQSINIGGATIFFDEDRYVLIPFGGGTVYKWENDKLTYIGERIDHYGIATDAIGSHSFWNGSPITGDLRSGDRLLISSNSLKLTEEIREWFTKEHDPQNHKDTAALLLRQEIEKTGLAPLAVLDICR